MSPGTLPDSAARHRATTDFDSNLVVLAGAGTGKTSLLVERLLVALGSDRVRLEDLAAITFTEKAAGEMRERLAQGLERLRELARDGQPADGSDAADRAFATLTGELGLEPGPIAQRALESMEQVDRATVVTIHGFCSELLRNHPVEAGVVPDFIVDTGEQEESLRQTVWEEFVAEELGPAATRAELWHELLEELPLGDIGGIAGELADFAHPLELLAADAVAPDPRTLFGPQVRRTLAAIESLEARQTGMAGVATRFFEELKPRLRLFCDEGLQRFQQELSVATDLAQRVRGDKGAPSFNAKLKGVEREEFKRVVRESIQLARALDAIDDRCGGLVLDAVRPFVTRFRERFLRSGFVSFNGLLELARNLLRDHPEVRRELKSRYRMLLVDELQDTDPLQYEIVFLLAEKTEESAASVNDVRFEPGRLFAVGDAKQSIYRFRGADFGAFRQAVHRGAEQTDDVLDLTGNFRSRPGILEPVNRLFGTADGWWEESDYQPGYVALDAIRPPHDGDEPAVELWTVDADADAGAQERREAEGRVLAAEIERLVEQGVCRYREISILFRAFSPISHYLRPLRQRGIPFVVDGGKEFLTRPEVHQLMSALRTLSQPADAPALLAFLRSPAGGVSDRELAAYAAAEGPWDWRRGSAEGFPGVDRCFRLLHGLAEETRELPADAAIRRVLDRACFLPLGAAAFEGAQRVANLRKLASAAGELARDGRFSLEQVSEALQEGRLADIQTDRPLADDAAEAVRITSIHRMKGLENAWVFLPDMARATGGNQGQDSAVSLVRLPDGSPALGMKTGAHTNVAGAWHGLEEQRHDVAEEVRVLYVALTRARERLVVLAGRAEDPGQRRCWADAFTPWGYDYRDPPADGQRLADGLVLHRRLQPEATMKARQVSTSARIGDAVERYREAVQRLQQVAAPPLRTPSGLEEERDLLLVPDATPTASPGRQLGRASGIVLHRFLEAWDGKTETVARLLQPIVAGTAAASGVPQQRLERAAAEILATVLASPLAEHFRGIEILGRELPLLLRDDDGQVFRGNIDLLYRDADGALVVADYKTDHETDEASLRQRHGEQLAVYAEAVRASMELDQTPRHELWLLRAGRRLTL